MTKRSLASSAALRASLLALLVLALVCVAPASFFVADGYQCPTVRVTCPGGKDEGDDVKFTARVNNMPSGRQPTYSWTVSSGRIIEGQNTRQIKVDSTGLGGRAITGIVTVGNIDEPCNKTGRCRTRIRTAEGVLLPNRAPAVTLSASTSRVLIPAECADGEVPDPNCAPTGSTVQITSSATDPDTDPLLYTFSTTGGRITGDAPNFTLDLSGVAPGTYTVTVEVDDGCDCGDSQRAFSQITITVERCGCAPRPAPPRQPEPESSVKTVGHALKEFAPLLGGGGRLE